MKNFILRLFKKIKFKLYFLLSGKSLKPTYIDDSPEYEKTGFKICLKIISCPETEFMIAPMSGKRYIKNDNLSIFITLDSGRIEITNHVYNYDIMLSKRNWERLIYIYNNETERRRIKMENEINSNIKNSLDNVLVNLKEINCR
jgi:hypothetical protein